MDNLLLGYFFPHNIPISVQSLVSLLLFHLTLLLVVYGKGAANGEGNQDEEDEPLSLQVTRSIMRTRKREKQSKRGTYRVLSVVLVLSLGQNVHGSREGGEGGGLQKEEGMRSMIRGEVGDIQLTGSASWVFL